MLGWKPIERKINPSLSLNKARQALEEIGFEEHAINPEHIIMKRSGTELTVEGDKLPVEVAVAKAESGLFLQVRYDTFVLFDTGDLERLSDDLVAKLAT